MRTTPGNDHPRKSRRIDFDRWGAFTYDQSKDLLRTDVPVKMLDKPVENFSITFTAQPDGANMVFAWDKTLIEIPVTIK